MTAARRDATVLIAILAGAAALRIATADYALWFDEFASLAFAHQPLGHLWSGWMVRESNPPLYYTLLKGWIALVGESDVALRLLSILIGLAGIAAAWSIAHRLGGRRAAIIIALWLALSPAHIAFSHEVRSYALAAAASLVAIRACIGLLDGRRLWLAVYVAAALTALYAHTTMVVFVALAGATMLWLLRRQPRACLGWVAAHLVVAAGWAWWAWISWRQVAAHSANIGWIARPTPADAWRIAGGAYLPTYTTAIGWSAGALLVMLLAATGRAAWRDRRPAIALLACLALGAPLLLFALSQIQPILLVRTLAWASAPAWIVVAAMLARAEPRVAWIVAAAIAAVEIVALASWLPRRANEAWPEALAAIARTDRDALVFVEGDAMALAATHYRGRIAPGLRIVAVTPDDRYDGWADGLYRGPRATPAEAAALLRRSGGAFALTRGPHDPAYALAAAGRGRKLLALTAGRQPVIWRWQWRGPHAALSMPSSLNFL